MEFQFYMPTRVCVGRGCVRGHSRVLNGLGKYALVLTGKHSAVRNGSLDDMLWALHQEGIQVLHVDCMPPNPTMVPIRAAVEKGREAGVNCVVAVGGGSVIDAAKVIAVLIKNDISDTDLIDRNSYSEALPLVAVPTTAGTGSEVTPYAIVTDLVGQTKKAVCSDVIFPHVAFLDASYTMQLSHEHTVATVVDALSHAIEGRLAAKATPLSNIAACESMKRIGVNLPLLCRKQKLSFAQREDLLVASMLAGMVIAHTGTTIVHAMGYSLTVAKGIDHGKANGLLLTAFLDYCANERPMDVHEIYRLLNIHNGEEFAAVMATLLGHLSVSETEIETFAEKASKTGHVQNTIPPPDLNAIIRMFRSSLQ